MRISSSENVSTIRKVEFTWVLLTILNTIVVHVPLFSTLDLCTRLVSKRVPKREVASSHFLHFESFLPSSYERHQSVVDLWHWRRWQDDKLILMYFYRDPFSSSLPDLLLQRRKLMKNPYVYPNDDKMMKWGDFYLIIISRDVGMWGKYFFKNVKQQDWKWILMLTASSRF